MNHKELMQLLEWSLNTPHKNGTNDCNLIVMKVIDLFAGTNISNRTYTTIKEGIEGLKKEGWNHTGEIVKQYCDVIEYPIDGDIWLCPDNPLVMAVVVSERILGVNETHDGFELHQLPSKGTYYRVRKHNG